MCACLSFAYSFLLLVYSTFIASLFYLFLMMQPVTVIDVVYYRCQTAWNALVIVGPCVRCMAFELCKKCSSYLSRMLEDGIATIMLC